MPTLTYPTPSELQTIDQIMLPTLTLDDELFEFFPMRSADADQVIWEQMDNYLGLQAIRGINGEPPRVKQTGSKLFTTNGMYFGEHEPIDEYQLMRRRQLGTYNQPIDATDLVRMVQDKLTTRRINRIRKTCWDLLCYGTYAIADERGVVMGQDSYTQRIFSAAVPWANATTAAPLANFRDLKRLARGYSMSLGGDAVAYMNSQTAEYFYSNLNTADYYGRRTAGLGTPEGREGANTVLAKDGLPQIVEKDDGYLDDNGVFQLFIPDNKVIVRGRRLGGARLGEWRMIRNVQNMDMAPGPYSFVVDNLALGLVPRTLIVHSGMNGAPVLYYPSSIIVMNV